MLLNIIKGLLAALGSYSVAGVVIIIGNSTLATKSLFSQDQFSCFGLA